MDIRIHSHFKKFDKRKNKEIQLKFTYISDLYYRLLRNVKVENGDKVIIEIYEECKREIFVSNGISVPQINIELDPLLFENESLETQFQLVTKAVNASLLELSEQSGWSQEIFLESYYKIRDTGFRLKFTLSRWKDNPKKSKKGLIEVDMGYSESYISFVYEDLSTNGVNTIQGLKLRGGDFSLSLFIGKNIGNWVDENLFRWYSKNKELELIFDSALNEVKIIELKPKNHVYFNMLKG